MSVKPPPVERAPDTPSTVVTVRSPTLFKSRPYGPVYDAAKLPTLVVRVRFDPEPPNVSMARLATVRSGAGLLLTTAPPLSRCSVGMGVGLLATLIGALIAI